MVTNKGFRGYANPRRFGARVGGTGGAQYIPATLMEVVTQAGQVTNPTTAHKTFIEEPDQAEGADYNSVDLSGGQATTRNILRKQNRLSKPQRSFMPTEDARKGAWEPHVNLVLAFIEGCDTARHTPLKWHLLARRKRLYVNPSSDAPTCNVSVFRSYGKLGHRKTLSDRASSTFQVVT